MEWTCEQRALKIVHAHVSQDTAVEELKDDDGDTVQLAWREDKAFRDFCCRMLTTDCRRARLHADGRGYCRGGCRRRN